ncbi:MAG: MFS transporter [Lachnospiraceae bacterium]
MGQKKQRLWTKGFVLIAIVNLLLYCGFQMLLPTLPIHTKALGGTNAMLGWLVGAATIGALCIRPLAGIALDKFGRKWIFIGGLCALLLVTLSYRWLATVAAIIGMRFLHGIAWGIGSTASSTIASDEIPKARFGEGMGFFSLSTSLAMALGPGLGLTILSGYGFQWLIGGAVFLGAAVLLLAFFVKTTSKTAEPGVAEPKSSEPITAEPGAAVETKRVAIYERASMLPAVVMFFVCATYGSITGFLSLYATERGIQNIGLFFTVYAVFLLLSRPVYGRLTDKLGFSVLVYPGLVLLMIALALLSRAATLPMFLISAAVYGMGFSALQSSLQTMAVLCAPKDRIGAANATFFTGFDGGIGVGSVIGGLIASATGYGDMYLYFIFFAVAAGIVYFVCFSKKSK